MARGAIRFAGILPPGFLALVYYKTGWLLWVSRFYCRPRQGPGKPTPYFETSGYLFVPGLQQHYTILKPRCIPPGWYIYIGSLHAPLHFVSLPWFGICHIV